MIDDEESMNLDIKYSDLFYMAVEFMQKFCDAAIDMGSDDIETEKVAAMFDDKSNLGVLYVALLRSIPDARMMRHISAKVHAVIASGQMPEHGMSFSDVFATYKNLGEGKA